MEARQIHFVLVADPGLAQLPLSMPVRRHLYLIGKEALNNLVKHSQATHATVHVRCTPHQLQVLIEDDGQGFEVTPPRRRTGQQSMQHRARAIGGVLRVGSTPGQGTRLELTVPYG